MTPDTQSYTVLGMTCDHCRLSVTEEVTEVAGVTDVAVDLDAKRVDVRGSGIDPAAVRAAIAEAGYEVAG